MEFRLQPLGFKDLINGIRVVDTFEVEVGLPLHSFYQDLYFVSEFIIIIQ